MRVVLFYPRGFNPVRGQTEISRLAVSLPPIGLVSIAAVIRQAGHEVKIIDAFQAFRVPYQYWNDKILEYRPDFLGFSTITANFLDAYNLCERIKKQCDRIRMVFGGVHVSWGKGEILSRFQAIDYVIAGEGENAFLALLNNQPPGKIAGLFYRDGPHIKQGPQQKKQHLTPLDDLPFPAYDLLDGFPRNYTMPLFSYPKHPGASIISSRGCIFQCDFCDRSVFKNTFRWHSPEYIYELITWLQRDFGVKHIMFYDDLFTLHQSRVAELCHRLRNSPLRISFNCIVRSGYIDKELIQELKSAGCWMVNVGIESADQTILTSYKKGLTLETIKRDIENIHNAGIWVKGLFILGSPHETIESMEKTIQFAVNLPLKDANITTFTPFPGSPIAENIKDLGSFDSQWQNWPQMNCTDFVFIPHTIGSKEVFETYYGKFIRNFYHRPFMRKVYRQMVRQSPHSYWRLLKHAAGFLRYTRNLRNPKKELRIKNL